MLAILDQAQTDLSLVHSRNIGCAKYTSSGAREMAQCLGALTALLEDMELVPKTLTVPHTICNTSSWGADALFWPL